MFSRADWKLVGIIAAVSLLNISFLNYSKLIHIFEYTNAGFPRNADDNEYFEEYLEDFQYAGRKFIPIQAQDNIIITLINLCFPVGVLCSWPLSNYLGRKRGIICTIALRLVALIFYGIGVGILRHSESPCELIAFSQPGVKILLWGAQFGESFYLGLLSLLGPLYVYEILPRKPSSTRGTICAASGLSLYFFVTPLATFLIYVTFYPMVQSNDYYWKHNLWWVTGAACGIPTGLLMLLFAKYFPESPYYLAFQQNKPEEARKALSMICSFRKEGNSEDNPEVHESPELVDRLEDWGVWGQEQSVYLMTLFCLFGLPLKLAYFRGEAALYDLLDIKNITAGNKNWPSVRAIIYFPYVLPITAYLIAFVRFQWNGEYFKMVTLKKSLFTAYLILLLISALSGITLWWGTNTFISVLSLLLSIIFVGTFSSVEIITLTLILKYPKQANRAGNFISSGFFGGILLMLICVVTILVLYTLSFALGAASKNIFKCVVAFTIFGVFAMMLKFVKNREESCSWNGEECIELQSLSIRNAPVRL